MPKFKSEVAMIKHEVLKEIAKLAFSGELELEINKLPRALSKAGITHYRCCVYKERAILAERAKFVLGFSCKEVSEELRLGQIAKKSLKGNQIKSPVIDIIDIACDQCPIDRYIVTDACRGCVAHYCINACPKKAITIVGRKAYIDQDKCIECGLCSRACQFHAIVEVNRPCERACPTDAIKPGPKRNSIIDRSMCTSCGVCVNACPFGAITEKSQIINIINWLRDGEKVVAAVAPSIVGQFGPKINLGQIFTALLALGFSATAEVAVGADIVAELDAEEFEEMVTEKGWVASSCCPAFVSFIKNSFPEFEEHVVKTPSPMIVLARELKKQAPDRKVVFIGPCIAKKEEALTKDSQVDAVLSFEELAAMFASRDIIPDELESTEPTEGKGSKWGRGFAVSGGVGDAVKMAHKHKRGKTKIQLARADGLEECKKLLNMARSGNLPGNFLEGMACKGGCVGGPVSVVEDRAGARAVKKLVK